MRKEPTLRIRPRPDTARGTPSAINDRFLRMCEWVLAWRSLELLKLAGDDVDPAKITEALDHLREAADAVLALDPARVAAPAPGGG